MGSMIRQRIFVISIMTVAWLAPLYGQEYPNFNFNIGGGMSTPLNRTGKYTSLSGTFSAGAGYNINKRNAIIGEFMWSALPPNRFALHPIDALNGSSNLYTATANYRYYRDGVRGSHFGAYAIAGGGWYYRKSVLKDYTVAPATVCSPNYYWWGFACESGYVPTDNVLASKASSAGGVNAGVDFTIRLSDTGWKFYAESRYHYAWSNRIPTTLIPVTSGLRFN